MKQNSAGTYGDCIQQTFVAIALSVMKEPQEITLRLFFLLKLLIGKIMISTNRATYLLTSCS